MFSHVFNQHIMYHSFCWCRSSGRSQVQDYGPQQPSLRGSPGLFLLYRGRAESPVLSMMWGYPNGLGNLIYQVWLYIICDFQFISRTLSWRQLVLAALTASTSSPGPRHSHPAGLLPQQYNPHDVGRLATWCRAIWSVKRRVICMGTQYWIERYYVWAVNNYN